jgi:DNA glycosylase AlkZ-like
LTERAVVRAHLMRNTVHLLTAEDFVSFRPLLQPLMERGLAGNFGRNLAGVDLAELKALAAALLSQDALTRVELGRRPEYDNLLLSFAERSRVIPHRRPVPLPPGNGATGGTLLVDGLWQADWKITEGTLEIRPHRRLSGAEMDAIAAEGARLLDFAGPPGTGQDVRFAPVS